MTRIRRCLAWMVPVVACHIGIALAALITTPARAQANPDTIYAVTNFDVAPAAAAQTVALLKQYRDAVRKEQGNQGVELFQEAGFPNRFAIHETWSNRAAFEANAKAPALEALHNGLGPIAGGPYDRRTYRPLSIGAAHGASAGNTAPGGAVYMLIHLDVFPPGLSPTLDLVKQVATDARKGEGNLRYDVEQSTSAQAII